MILNDPDKVQNRTWGGSLQKYIGEEMGISDGQVRTIKRMMEEFDIIKPGALNQRTVPDKNIYIILKIFDGTILFLGVIVLL